MLVKMHPNAAMHSRYHHNRPYLPLYGDLFTVAVLITYLIAGKTHRIDAFAASEQLLRIGCEATSIKYKSSQFTFLTFNAHREIPFYLHFFLFIIYTSVFPKLCNSIFGATKQQTHTHTLPRGYRRIKKRICVLWNRELCNTANRNPAPSIKSIKLYLETRWSSCSCPPFPWVPALHF